MDDQTSGLAAQISAMEQAESDPDQPLIDYLTIELAPLFARVAQACQVRLTEVASAKTGVRFDRLETALDTDPTSQFDVSPELMVAIAEAMLGNDASIGTPKPRPLTEIESSLLARLQQDFQSRWDDTFSLSTNESPNECEDDQLLGAVFDVTVGSLRSHCVVRVPRSKLLRELLGRRKQLAAEKPFELSVEISVGSFTPRQLQKMTPGDILPLSTDEAELMIDGKLRGTVTVGRQGSSRSVRIQSLR